MIHPAYPDYRKSEVEWLDKVPSHWANVPIKYMALEKKSLFLDGDWIESKDISGDEIRYITTGNVGEGLYKEQGTGFITEEKFKQLDCTEVFEGDILISRLNAPIGRSCIVPNLTSRIVTSVDNVIFRADAKYHKQFIVHLFSSKDYFKHTSNLARGATMQRISRGLLGNIRVVIPPYEEQQKVANFLDHETAKIDTLIKKQQQLIKLLKEKRQAVISHAVTKGLNPNAPMRDSGVEWLGEVPEHWVVRRLKHTSKLQSGIPKGKDLTGKISISVPMLRVANVQDGYFNLEDVHSMEIEPDQLDRFSLEYGDVLMNEGGDNDKLGRGAVWKSEVEPCIHQNHVFAIRPYSIEPEWLDFMTRASYAKFHFFRVAKQSTNLASISSTNIKETPLVIPPGKERIDIMEYVSRKISAFDKAGMKCSAQIILLQERRTALISAAVTGKIDVRNWQAPAPANTNKKEVAA